jgi:hypothetical protein
MNQQYFKLRIIGLLAVIHHNLITTVFSPLLCNLNGSRNDHNAKQKRHNEHNITCGQPTPSMAWRALKGNTQAPPTLIVPPPPLSAQTNRRNTPTIPNNLNNLNERKRSYTQSQND